ncbi:MAG: hypothetical protein QXI19_00450 [Candidatus Caldarchaeum sp.]
MTLILAFKWAFEKKDGGLTEAVLVSSDSKATTSIGVSYEVKKVYPIFLMEDKPVAIAGGAGDPSLAKWGFEVAEDILLKYARDEYPVRFTAFRKAVREMEYRFARRFSELRNMGLDPGFQMVLCGLDPTIEPSGRASIYTFDSKGLAEPVHDNPGYAVIGSGFVTGGILLLRMLGYTMELDLGLLSTFIVDAVSEVDTAVGPFLGESYLMRVEENGEGIQLALGPLKEEALIQYKERSAKRKDLIKKLWRLCDEMGEEEVEKALNRLPARKN